VTSSAVRILRRRPDAAREARREVRDFCQSRPPDLIGDAELVASELVTNAFLHGSGEIRLKLRLVTGGVRVAVADEGPGGPRVVEAASERRHGRGIALVDRVAASWGVLPAPGGGKEVWCLVSSRPPVLLDQRRAAERV
jgi:anti-sigma regulatory factor (Ser/Thr protein kinase)